MTPTGILGGKKILGLQYFLKTHHIKDLHFAVILNLKLSEVVDALKIEYSVTRHTYNT